MGSDLDERRGMEQLQAVIDQLDANVAVLGPDGTIDLVNSCWVQFAAENGDSSCEHTGPGSNYFDACTVDGVIDGDFAHRALDGIDRVLRREIPSYSLEYPCHSPAEERWFLMLVAPAGASGAMVTHVDVSAEHRRGGAMPNASPWGHGSRHAG